MSRGYSLHIGLNAVDPKSYGGWSGPLRGCENDAHAMQNIARSQGFAADLLLTSDATSTRVLTWLRSVAATARAGDKVLISYSGHGSQAPDVTGSEETDRLDETWCLFDRMLIDDEIFASFCKFAQGVTAVVFSDSCHSGTVVREVGLSSSFVGLTSHLERTRSMAPDVIDQSKFVPRLMELPLSLRLYDDNRSFYTAIQMHTLTRERDVPIPIVLISGCQDNQVSMDGPQNGVFTDFLLRTWDGGKFRGTYEQLHSAITQKMPQTQVPNLYLVGPGALEAARAPAFSLS